MWSVSTLFSGISGTRIRRKIGKKTELGPVLAIDNFKTMGNTLSLAKIRATGAINGVSCT